MRRPLVFSSLTAAVAATVLLVACQDEPTSIAPTGPELAISDGRILTGNPDFFWLPPITSNPSGDPNFGDPFNPNLAPGMAICLLADPSAGDAASCLTPFVFDTTPAVLVAAEELYKVEWSTPDSLTSADTLRVFAFVGTTELGFVDVSPRDKGMKNVETDEFFEFQEGRTIPIKFRIEEAALCHAADPDFRAVDPEEPCASETINGAEGGEVVLATGDRVIVPAQDEGGVQREFTLTLQLCDGIDVDLPTFGNCLDATVDPPLSEEPLERFSPFINVLICSLDPESDPAFGALSEAQEDLVTLYRQDDGEVFALPKSVASCPTTTGQLDATSPWRFARALLGLLGPQRLYASAAVLNTGSGGDSPFTSKFQLVLPAQMALDPTTTDQTAEPGTAVTNPPAVVVTDLNGDFVAGATVTFAVQSGDGAVTGPEGSTTTESGGIAVVTGSVGRAALAEWTLGAAAGINTVRAFGRGIAGPEDGGPFMPDLTQDLGQNQDPIPVGTGEETFTAAACDQPCSVATINGAEGGEVVLETGDRVIVPPQDENGVQREFTLTLQLCDGIDVDLPTFGNCLEATADPPLANDDPETAQNEAERFSPFINVLICSLNPESDPAFGALSEAQEDFLTLYRQDDGDVFALSKSVASCPSIAGTGDGKGRWNLVRAVFQLFTPQPLYASGFTAVLNTGSGGDSPFTSKYQLALPAQMDPDPATDDQTAEPGTAVANPPAVIVTDVAGQPVVGATVNFAVVSGDGTVVPTFVVTEADGRAELTNWTLGPNAGTNTVRAFGRAIADPQDDGPFMPDLAVDLGRNQPPILTTTGEVIFTAEAATATPATGVIDFETYPDGSPTCSDCAVGNEYAAASGVVFSFASEFTSQTQPHILLNSNNPEGVSNHDVTFPPGETGGRVVGTTIMTFSGSPTAVRFEARVNNDITEIPVAAFDPSGAQIAASQVTRSDAVVYNPGTVDFRQETITVSNTGGIGRIELSGGGAGGFLILLDDLQIGVPVTIDGVLEPGEWDDAAVTDFTATVPGGGTTPARLFVKNDDTNLYLAVRFERSVVDADNLLNFEFDNDNDGTGPEDGDDYITFTPTTGFSDAHRTGGGSSVTNDNADGAGAFANDGAFTVYEMSHPLNSGETGKDFALTPPTTIGMLLQLNVGGTVTRYPAGTFPTYVSINITSP